MVFRIYLIGIIYLSSALLGFSLGEQVFIRFPQVKLNDKGRCHLPEVFTVVISQVSSVDVDSRLSTMGFVLSDLPGGTWEIRLKRNEDPPASGYVYVLRQVNDQYFLQLQKLDHYEREDFHGYHNYSVGAAVTVKCVTRKDGSGLFYRLEGPVFKGGSKFILNSSLEPLNTDDLSPEHVTAAYDMTHVEEHRFADAAWVLGKKGSSAIHDRHPKMEHTESLRAHRIKRQTPLSYYIDILTFIDASMYRKWLQVHFNDSVKTKESIKSYMTNIYTSVNMRLETLNLAGIKLVVKMLPIVFPENEAESPWTTATKETVGNEVKVNATKLLTTFGNWLKLQAGFVYDHAVLLTSYDIYGGGDGGNKFNITKGLAFIGTLCQGSESSSIIEEKGAYQSEGIIAHELGHSLGALHDLTSNGCPPENRYLMSDGTYASNAENALNPWIFSQCSSKAIAVQIKKMQENLNYRENCLQKGIELGENVGTFVTKDPTEQCRSFYGAESFTCRGLFIPSFTHICDEFYCHVPGTDVCEKMTAPLGMCCGYQKKCIQGQCMTGSAGECSMDDECPLGDQPGPVLNNKNCSQLESAYCYEPDFNTKCCQTCKKWKAQINQTNCIYGDKRTGCRNDNCDASTDGIANRFFCCKTCQGLPPADYTRVTVGNRSYSCQELIKEKTASICYNKEVHANACPIACESVRDEASNSCPWGDRNNCTGFILTLSPGSKCPEDRIFNCCKSCADVVNKLTTNVKSTVASRPTTIAVTTTAKTSTTATTTTTKASTATSKVKSSTVSTTTTAKSSVTVTSKGRTSSTVTPPNGTSTTKPNLVSTPKITRSGCDILRCTAITHFNVNVSVIIIIFSNVLNIFLNYL